MELFVEVLRHDLVNPVSAIKEAVEIIIEQTTDKEIGELALMVKRLTRKIAEMIQCAEVYARIESTSKLERKSVNLSDMFRTAAVQLKNLISEKDLRLEFFMPELVEAHVNHFFENVFLNLLSNAVKYSPPGKKIEAGITLENESFRIYVKDWGCGIEDEVKPMLFTRFQRPDKQGVKGSGLGLAIVKRLAELHGGRVWIENNPEGGSVFIVRIPR